MKWLLKINPRHTSGTMLVMAILLIGSMALREYAHFHAHANQPQGQPVTAQSRLNHDAKFHFVTEAEPTFEPPFWHQQVVAVVQPVHENTPFARPHLLPETRAPPVSV